VLARHDPRDAGAQRHRRPPVRTGERDQTPAGEKKEEEGA
jgi:hypothetical protein